MIANAVILADNDALMRSLIRSVLLRAQLQIFPVANGREAVGLARQFRAGLVLLDVAMPNGDGLEACREIRALPGYGRVPIVMLTGYHDQRIRDAAFQVGASDFLTKPFQPNKLLSCMAGYLPMPAELQHSLAASFTGDSRLPGVRGQVWEPRDLRPPNDEHADLADGREMMRIFRDGERG